MRKYFLIILVAMLLIFQGSLWAEVEISGRIETDNRLLIEEDGKFTRNENIFSFKVKSSPSPQISVFGEVELRYFGFPEVSNTSDLIEKEKVDPWKLELRESYIDYYGFIFEKLDLRVGKQRIAWGTADKLNPTDNLNPYDFYNPLDLDDFGKKLATNSLKLTYYVGDFTLTSVFLPTFTPAVLPPLDWTITPSLPLPPGMNLGNMTNFITLPESEIANSMSALKLERNILNYDMSLSYYSGRDSLPITKKITLTPADATTMDINIQMVYPTYQVIGYDLAGSIRDIGVWFEIAHFIPKKIEQEIISSAGSSKEEILKEPYTKYAIGSDYTFKNGTYINTQFAHGYFDERGKDLTNLLMASIEKKVFADKLKLALALGGQIDFDSEDGVIPSSLIFPYFSYYPLDATEIQLGCYLIDGKEESKFGPFRKNDEIYLKFKFSF